MIKPSQAQAVLLATAAQHPSGSELPLHASVPRGGGTGKAIVGLLRHRWVQERNIIGQEAPTYRVECDVRIGLFITNAGRAAVKEFARAGGAAAVLLPEIIDVEQEPAKLAMLLRLLDRADWIAASELTQATGWFPHTLRAAILYLRKKRHGIQRWTRSGCNYYRLSGKR